MITLKQTMSQALRCIAFLTMGMYLKYIILRLIFKFVCL